MANLVLGSKFNHKAGADHVWRDVLNNPFNYVSKMELEDRVTIFNSRIEEAKEEFGKTSGIAWSGGKDSNVICHLMEKLNCTKGVYASPDTDFEYSNFIDYIKKEKPEWVQIVYAGISWKWLNDNPEALWPDRWGKGMITKINNKWNKFKWKTQKDYFFRNDLSFMVMGRRKIDGNYVGRNKTGSYQTKDGFTVVNAIHDWPHEFVLAYIHEYNIPLPDCYHVKNGFWHGARCWPLDCKESMLDMEPELYFKWKDRIEYLLKKSKP